ncbi:MAG TPA: hypothetical protein VGZ27_17915 [Vicinamibacterales bacterium]|jgi:hypothetical protein|nr:hypothetical protein [Vicinamibacterales bacterium]
MKNSVERADQKPRMHPTRVALSRPPAAEVDAGTDIVLKIKASCPYGCDLRGRVINVMAPNGAVVAASELAEFSDSATETTEFAFAAPDEVGEYSWTLVFPKCEAEGLVHEEGSLPITVKSMAHDTSLAVWGVPSPIVIDHPFRIHVGATCSAGCDLKGKEIQICDETGAGVARGQLGETPWDGTRALYWTEVDLVAPAGEGATSRSISFAPRELKLPHGAASARFGFETVKPPQYSVTVKVVQKDAGTPVEDAQVRLGVYFACSDQTGQATVAMPQGTYGLDVLKTGYEALSRVLDVNGDVTVEVEVAVIPPENPDAYWLFDPAKRI